MATQTLLKELDSKTLQSFINERVYQPFYWRTFFPFERSLFLTYKTLIGSEGRSVAADVVTYNASAPEKTRKVVDRLQGDIPPIRMKKKMDEEDLNEYDMLVRLGTAPNDRRLLQLIFDDVSACVDGVEARLEFLAMKALFQQSITLSAANNNGVVTENAIDFQLRSAGKRVIKSTAASREWTEANAGAAGVIGAQPITDIKVILAAARSEGIKLNYMLMNATLFEVFASNYQVGSFTLPWTADAVVRGDSPLTAPSITEVNRAFAARSLPQIVVVDTAIDVETTDHTKTTIDPTLTEGSLHSNVIFLSNLVAGVMKHGPIAEEQHPVKQVTYSKKGPILVSKYAETDPVSEWTLGQLNAFPSFPTIDSIFRLDTNAKNANGVAA